MSTQTLRPNNTLFTGSGSLTGGASINAVTSDSSTASYVTFDDGDGFVVLLDSYTLGSGEIVKSMQLSINARATAGAVASLSAYITDGLVQGYPGSILTGYLLGSSNEVLTGATSSQALTQTQIDDLAVYVILEVTFGAGPIRVNEVYVTMVVAAAPTCAVTGPTGAQGTPTPTVTWTYTQGSDGGPQAKYRVKIYSAAQYGAGGFDPDTSTATYDTGTLTGTATLHTLTSNLPNSTTWRAYVQVAHTINGQDAWSAWDYEGFTTSFVEATVDTITAVPTDASGLFTITVTRDTGSHAWETVDIERTDDSGTTWVPVRGGTATTATNTWVTTWGANTVVIVDYEVPNGATVSYRARGNWTNAGVPVPGTWEVSGADEWESTDVWLKAPFAPSLNQVVEFEADPPTLNYGIDQGVYRPIGRATPVVISDVRQAASGDLALETDTFTAGTALKALLDSTVLLLQLPAGMTRITNMYIAIAPVEEVSASVATEWLYWRTTFVVVDRPADDTA